MQDETTSALMPRNKKNTMMRKSQDRATIQFGEPLKSENYSKRWRVMFQYFCYLYFVTKMIFRLLIRQRHRFIINFIRFMSRGRKEGANTKIVFAYFLSSSGDNLFS